MQPRFRVLLVLGFAAGLLAAAAGDLPAQDKKDPKAGDAKGEKAVQADIVTVDKVELKAKFFPSAKGKEAPVVLLLHALGDNSSNKEWNAFARKLQDKGYAVLIFDFRGHGDSTTVQPGMPNPKNPQLAVRGFWDQQFNQMYAGGFNPSKPRPTEIKYEKFATNYYSALANDIAAAKAFLDEQDCNSSNMIVIGAKDGATIGALWVSSEFQRFRYLPPGPGAPKGMLDRDNPEGLEISALILLSATPTVGNSKGYVNVSEMLKIPVQKFKLPVLLLYGQGDDKGKKMARESEKALTGNNKKDFPYVGSLEVADADKAVGRELLVGSLETTTKILEFLDSLPPNKMAAKMPKKTGEETYIWEWVRQGVPQQATARKAGAKMNEYGTYGSFLK